MTPHITIGGRAVGEQEPCYVVAELSANHGGEYGQAERLVRAAAESGADAVKVQTYTADTLTLRSDASGFVVEGEGPWQGRSLHELYSEGTMPWGWQPRLAAAAAEAGVQFFSSPFDATAVDFLIDAGVPALKIASPEIVDVALIRRAVATGRPVILSTGMATLEEIELAVEAARAQRPGAELALLQCTSAYPTPPAAVNLLTMVDMKARFGVPVGLSDHTMGSHVAIAAAALGAAIVEKHLCASRAQGGIDAHFSLEPNEFADMVAGIRAAEQARGRPTYEPQPEDAGNRQFRRSLFVVEDVKAGEAFSEVNVRSLRPSLGLAPRHLDDILGRPAARDIARGSPLRWEMVAR